MVKLGTIKFTNFTYPFCKWQLGFGWGRGRGVIICNWYDKGRERGWSRNWGNYCNEQKPEHLYLYFSFLLKN